MKLKILSGYQEYTTSEASMRTIGEQYHPNYFRIHSSLGEGYVFFREPEPGFQIRCFNCRLKEAADFMLADAAEAGERRIHLFCMLSIPLRKMPGEVEWKQVQQGLNELFVCGSRFNGTLPIASGCEIKMVELLVEEGWFFLQYDAPEEAELRNAWERIRALTALQAVPVSDSVLYHSILQSVVADVHKGAGSGLLLKSHALELVDFVMRQLVPEQAQHPVDEHMLQVRDLVHASVYGKLPAIETMARQMAMSESTLKRKFRKAFGSGIYEYYVKKKMETARALLSERNARVSEVAFRLSYEKVSHFIEMFRRHYGTSPGRIRDSN